ncbi:unnamed protein product, partial [Allacma fusca]
MWGTLTNFLFTLFVTYFLRVYIFCLSIIALELQNVVQKDEPKDSIRDTTAYGDPNSSESLTAGCVRAYEVMDDLISRYDLQFGLEIILQILLMLVVVTLQIFIAMFFYISGNYFNVIWIALYVNVHLFQVYHLASVCSALDRALKAVLAKLYCIDSQQISKHLFIKVSTLTLKLSTNAPAIRPGQFFKVDRHLVTS